MHARSTPDEQPVGPARSTLRVSAERASAVVAWSCVAAPLLVTGCIWSGGDLWWWATALMLAPRWPWLIVGALGLLGLPLMRWRWPPVAALALGVVLLTGFRVPLSTGRAGEPSGPPLQVVTMNIRGGAAQLDPLAREWRDGFDAVFLQEASGLAAQRAIPEGWSRFVGGAGVCVASPHPIRGAEALPRAYMPRWGASAVRCTIQVGGREIGLVGVHLRTPRDGVEALLRDKLAGVPVMQRAIRQRRQEARRVHDWLQAWPGAEGRPIIVAGDFNTTVESRVYQQYWGGLSNAFGAAGWGRGLTKLTSWHGARIDHILCGGGARVLAARTGHAHGSDHRPVYATIAPAWQPLPGASQGARREP